MDEHTLRVLHTFLAAAVDDESAEGIVGPVVAVRDDVPLLERVVALTGRDPQWRPPGAGVARGAASEA
ncbi:hypothetical protein [Streptomyces reniochalinae]|uniref:Uncharacterized protein n=1 Tax=Streptomyces reniochalinae TaxID=2250578 RepID=A0A367EGB1_9ACTN|nr:hypothetical protein [Streptomyces reniochalinae]RCG17003.1 hypothetical protein DQ392_18195 [Streptomyces reniochalinae]